ncbi:MAG: nuclease [Blastocatellia bacterium]
MHRQRLSWIWVVVAAFLTSAVAPPAAAWGEDGHRFVNRVAAEHLPEQMPPFFRNSAARLTFLGPEPDRWRDTRELYKALTEVNGPDHFIDIDKAEEFDAIPNDRYQYADWLRSKGKDPKDVGYLPYSILENFQKVQVLFRMWRDPQHSAERDQIEQNIVYYAGVLGHYVADGSQPLHASIHYNGWTTSSNPDLYTREPLHGRFESEYVKAQIKPEDFSGLVKTASRLQDPFADIMKYLIDSYNHVPELYKLDKTARWEAGNRNPESKKFVTQRLAAGSQMLANLWYTAWLGSASSKSEDR